LMRPDVGGIAYDPDVYLRFGSPDERQHLSLRASSSPSPPQEERAGERRPICSSEVDSKAAGQTLESNTSCVELHLIDQTTPEPDSSDSAEEQSSAQSALLDLVAVEREARLVALRLLELRKQRHLIWDAENQQFRSVEWRDVAVLMRSPAGKVEAFAKEFNRLGVPLSAARGGFFESIEIQ